MRISDWSSDVCSSDLQYEKLHRSAHLRNVYRSAFADRPDIQARSAFRQGPSHRRFPIGPAPNPCASGGTSRAHHRSRHLYPAQPLRVSASPRELVSWWPLRPLHKPLKRLQQHFYLVHRDDANGLDLARRAALDHRREDLAAELDELRDADVFHRGDAFAPADAAGDLLHEQVEIGRAHV